MVCKNDEKCVLVRWDDKTIFSLVVEPTEYEKKLLNAVNKLPIVCRRVLILYAFGGMQRQEIAAIMETSLAAIRFLIHRSGLLLQEHLSDSKDSSKQGVALRDFRLSEVFLDWPYREYAKLVELRKNMVFWSRF